MLIDSTKLAGKYNRLKPSIFDLTDWWKNEESYC